MTTSSDARYNAAGADNADNAVSADTRTDDRTGHDKWKDLAEGINENGGPPVSSEERAVSDLAYEIWEREGRPEGKHGDHWLAAEQELRDKSRQD